MKEYIYPQQTTYGKMKPGITPYSSHFLKWKKGIEERKKEYGKREMNLCTTKERKQMKNEKIQSVGNEART